MPAPHHSSFLQAGCPSCHPPTASKHWRQSTHYTRKTFYDIRLANCKQHQWYPLHKKDLTFLVINKSSMRHWTFIVSGSNDFYQSCMFFDNKHTRHILLRDKMPSATDLMAVGICWDIVVKYLTDSVYGPSVLTEKVCHNWHCTWYRCGHGECRLCAYQMAGCFVRCPVLFCAYSWLFYEWKIVSLTRR